MSSKENYRKASNVKKFSIVGSSGKAARLRCFLAKYPHEALKATVVFCKCNRPEVEISARIHSIYHNRKDDKSTQRVNQEDLLIVVEMPTGHELKCTYVGIYNVQNAGDRNRCGEMTKYCVKEIIFPGYVPTPGLFKQERSMDSPYKRNGKTRTFHDPEFFPPTGQCK